VKIKLTALRAFTGITAVFTALYGFQAQAATPRAPHSHASDCKRVAKADRKLCAQVQAQHSYGAYYGDPHAYWSNPNGRVLVHELTHDDLTQGEMRAGLRGYAAEYREWVTAVPVNMDAMVKKCGNTDGQWVVGYVDEDDLADGKLNGNGKRGGLKLTYARIVCA
jgi:hypothetical protein